MPTVDVLTMRIAGSVHFLWIVVFALVLMPASYLAWIIVTRERVGLSPPNEMLVKEAYSSLIGSIVWSILLPGLVTVIARRRIAQVSPTQVPHRQPKVPDAYDQLLTAYSWRILTRCLSLQPGTMYLIFLFGDGPKMQPGLLATVLTLLAVLAAQFPSTARIAHWIEKQLRWVEVRRAAQNA